MGGYDHSVGLCDIGKPSLAYMGNINEHMRIDQLLQNLFPAICKSSAFPHAAPRKLIVFVPGKSNHFDAEFQKHIGFFFAVSKGKSVFHRQKCCDLMFLQS
ncbi:hypothetical protein SDC9_97244 [bioreactor metagenome]|uniref:Uncharacterized protein n=1 Tax=bioreactor metagenome TaxID=1076179 RepID=A0A645ABD6_9ZZZZ